MALRMCNIDIDINTVDKIIDLVELIEEKGYKTTIQDIQDLQEQWN